jgi:hypothetical protein
MNRFAACASTLLFALFAAGSQPAAAAGAPAHDCTIPITSDASKHIGPQCGDPYRGMALYGQLASPAISLPSQPWACNQCHSNNPLTDTINMPAPAPSLIRAAPRDPAYIQAMMYRQPEAVPIIVAMENCPGNGCLADRPPSNVMGDLGDIAEFLYTCDMGQAPCVTYTGPTEGTLAATGAPLDFGAVPVGSSSAPASISLSNIGMMQVTVSDVTTSNAAEFPITNNGCGHVAPTTACDIVLKFLPNALGARSTTVTVYSDGLGNPQTFTVKGTGVGNLNYTGLWWKSPPNSESGWGVNLAHQGDLIFATWYTYDPSGKPWWLSMLAHRTGPASYSGAIYSEQGPPFNAFAGSGTPAQIGTGTLTFTDGSNGSFSYTVNGMAQVKAITRYDLSTGAMTACTYSATPNLAGAGNYQDLWWAASGTESGWGVNFAHQGDTLFATWYTYGADNAPLWLSALAPRVGASNVYTGTLYRTSGPRFDAYDAAKVLTEQVGTATFTFADGNHATFSYTTNGGGGLPAATQSKTITRYLFAAPAGTLCN